MIVARVRRTSSYTSQNDNDFVTWEEEVDDTWGFWSAGDPTKLIIPSGYDGWITQARITAIWEGDTGSSYRELKIFLNGDITEPWGVVQVSPNSVNLAIQCETDWLPGLVAGDYFTFALKSLGDELAQAFANYSIYASIAMVRSG